MFFIMILIAVILALIPATIAQHKGRSFLNWWIYGTLLWIIALPHSLIMHSKVRSGMKKCPICAEVVKAEALKCKHCGEGLGRVSEAAPTQECPKCRKAYDSSWKTCLQCSVPLIARTNQSPR